MKLDSVARGRIIDRALSLSSEVEKAYRSMKKAGADDEADGMLASMLELMRSLKDSLAQPESMTQESARQFSAQIDGLIQQFSRRGPVRKTRKGESTEDVEDEADDVEEDDDGDTIQKAVRRRLRGEIGGDDLMRLLNFKVG
jgi:hypothetical protein